MKTNNEKKLSQITTIVKSVSGGGSKQFKSDLFTHMYTEENGLIRPPYNMDQLLALKEASPIHASCISQKCSDIAGLGWKWIHKTGDSDEEDNDEDAVANTEDNTQLTVLESFLDNCNEEMTFREIIEAVWNDFETLGWGIMEIVRNGKGQPVEIYHVPAQTVRAHEDGTRFVQSLNGKFRWFKRLNTQQDFNINTGEPIKSSSPDDKKAGELLVIRKVGGRSSYYGIPDYVAAIGTIVGSVAARDYNISFFNERMIPDLMLIVKGAFVTPEVEEQLTDFFRYDVKSAKSKKLAILPLPMGDDVDVKLERLTESTQDSSFDNYRNANSLEICIAHRVPPYRIGWPITGAMGGSTAKEMSEIYKRSVIEPGQEILEHRMNNQLFKLFEPTIGKITWKWKLDEIDIDDKIQEINYATAAVTNGIYSPNEARVHLGLPPYEGGEQHYISGALKNVNAIDTTPQAIAPMSSKPLSSGMSAGTVAVPDSDQVAGSVSSNAGRKSIAGIEDVGNNNIVNRDKLSIPKLSSSTWDSRSSLSAPSLETGSPLMGVENASSPSNPLTSSVPNAGIQKTEEQLNLWNKWNTLHKTDEKKISNVANKYFIQQMKTAKELSSTIKKSEIIRKANGSDNSGDGGIEGDLDGLIGQMFNSKKDQDFVKKNVVPMLLNVFEDYYEFASDMLPDDYNTPEWDDQISTAAGDWVMDYAQQLFTDINTTTKNEIKQKIIENYSSMVDQKEDFNTLFDNSISDTYEDALDQRIILIGVTETTTMASSGMRAAFVNSGILQWQWFTAPDEKTCPECQDLNGAIETIGEPFTNDGVIAPPIHPNCRCMLFPVLYGDNYGV